MLLSFFVKSICFVFGALVRQNKQLENVKAVVKVSFPLTHMHLAAAESLCLGLVCEGFDYLLQGQIDWLTLESDPV